jgi:hypothetical protein
MRQAPDCLSATITTFGNQRPKAAMGLPARPCNANLLTLSESRFVAYFLTIRFKPSIAAASQRRLYLL